MLRVNASVLESKRVAKGLSQHALSKQAGLCGNAVYRMERKKHKVSRLRLMMVANVLGCKVEDLVRHCSSF